ncbi:MAG: thioester domain-containing protein [Microbacterium sp.]
MISQSLRSAGRLRSLHTPSVVDATAPLPAVLWRGRGGTYSSTVGRLRLDDESTVLTDLIRLSPNVDAYSLDPLGESPRHLTPYRLGAWADAPTLALRENEAAIVWILSHSYPTVDVATLSARVRASGREVGTGDIPIPEAIAATQAALWTIGSGLRPHRGLSAPLAELSRSASREVRTIGPTAPASFVVDLPSAAVVTGYRVDLHESELRDSDLSGLEVRLEVSATGSQWHPVSSSRLSAADGRSLGDGRLRLRKGIGVGATVSRARSGRVVGYAHYRLIVSSTETRSLRVDGIGLDVAHSATEGNAQSMLALYDYLCAGVADRGGSAISGPRSALASGSSIIGPFRTDPDTIRFARVTASDRRVAVIDTDGRAVQTLEGGDEFHLDVSRAGPTATVALAVDVLSGWRTRGRVLLGSSHGGARPCTTLALAVRERVDAHRIVLPVTYRSARGSLPLLTEHSVGF